jgi:hypothetical protein
MGNERKVESNSIARLIMHVPELPDRPVIGGGCCAVTAEFLFEETLTELSDVRSVQTTDDRGLVNVEVTNYSEKLAQELRERIEELGYSVEDVTVAVASR